MTVEEYKEGVRNKIKSYARVNFLSPSQEHRLLQLDYDVDFLQDRLYDYLKSPDIKYLQNLFLPRLTACPIIKKELGDIGFAVAAGDIIGSQYEFTEHDYRNLDAQHLISERSFFTDDTVLSYATIDEIHKRPFFPNFRKAYLNAYKKHPDAGYGSSFVRWANEIGTSNKRGYGSFANGSAMRVAGIGVHYKNVKDVIKYAIQSAVVTHNHQSGIKGAVVTAVAVWMAKNGCSKDNILEYVSRFYSFNEEDTRYLLYKENYFNIKAELKFIPNEPSKASVFCDYAVPFAIKCFLETDSYKNCMTEILRHFCDADTICAIAGGICYAYYGNINLSHDDILLARSILTKGGFIE